MTSANDVIIDILKVLLRHN